MSQAHIDQRDALYKRLKARLTVDALRLDQELAELPAMITDAGEALAYCVSARDIAKNELDVNTAIVADRLRQAPIKQIDTETNQSKTKWRSEAQITSELPQEPVIRKSQERLEDAKLDMDLWRALVDGLRAKSSALETIARLIISGYLAPSSVSAPRREELRRPPSERMNTERREPPAQATPIRRRPAVG
jgi:hypothetical protein